MTDERTVSQRIDAFWSWWSTIKDELADSLSKGRLDAWSGPLSDQVEALADGLSWDFGPGKRAKYHLCISATGDMEKRALTERWLSRAPADDPLWEFYPARQAREGALQTAGVDLPSDSYRVSFERDEAWNLLNVKVFNPRLKGLSEEAQRHAVFLFLDGLLGEDGVERSIGGVTWYARRKLRNAKLASDLVAAVDSLRDAAKKSLLIETDRDGQACVVSVASSTKRIDHALFCWSYEISFDLAQPTSSGLCSDEEAAAISAMEEDLARRLGDSAVYLGRETRAGKRVLHYHADEIGPVAGHIDEWRQAFPTYAIEFESHYDPHWRWLYQFRRYGADHIADEPPDETEDSEAPPEDGDALDSGGDPAATDKGEPVGN